MGALSELLGAANPANPANRLPLVRPDSRDSRDSQPGASAIRTPLPTWPAITTGSFRPKGILPARLRPCAPTYGPWSRRKGCRR
jgi:hypothetical protein